MVILSLNKDCMDKIREDVSLAVVFVWEQDGSRRRKLSCRSGFVIDYEEDRCVVLTLSKGLDAKRKIWVRFSNGQSFEGNITLCGNSHVAAILVDHIMFPLKKVEVTENAAEQCDSVIHGGCFDKKIVTPQFSSGSVGLRNHNNIKVDGEPFTRFSHSCSEKRYMLGAPVFNIQSEFVGMNYSQKKRKNIFFAFDLAQFKREMKRLFGDNDKEGLARLLSGAENKPKAAKRRRLVKKYKE